MNLQVPPDAPWIAHAGAAILLTAHIAGGAMGMASGAMAMVAPKGSRLHRVSGTVFLVAMLSMAGVGATVAPFLPEAQWTNTLAGIFTLYVVLTGWMTGRRPPGQVGRFEKVAVAVPIGLATLVPMLGIAGAGRGDPTFGAIYAFAVISALAAAADLRMIRSGGLTPKDRLARHVWRMGLALFVAMGSFFFGQPRFVPDVLKETGLNAVPPLFAIGLTLFWLVRVRLPRRRQTALA
jgi:uncharacterized membrane protein